MEFGAFDIFLVLIVLFLGLKGIINGFTKELFNLIGLIGGVAVASRFNREVGEIISHSLFPIKSESSLELVGFIATLLAIWLVFLLISSIFEQVFSGEVGFLSRILGYILGIIKYIAIFAIIIVGIEQSQFLSEKFSKYHQDSKLYPMLNDIGIELLNRDANQTISTTNNSDINLSDFALDSNQTQNKEH
jgi:membrane protein required for colicin V production